MVGLHVSWVHWGLLLAHDLVWWHRRVAELTRWWYLGAKHLELSNLRLALWYNLLLSV